MYHRPVDRNSHSPTCPGTQHESPMVSRRGFVISGAAALGAVLLGGGQRAIAAVPHRIDVHHHIIPPPYLEKAPPSANFQRTLAWTPQKTLEEMDQNGIAVSMLSFATPYLWFSGIEPGRQLARMCNDYCAEHMRENVGRFGLFAGLPPLGDTEGCLREIAYALETLHADGVTVMTSYGDHYLGDAAYAPVWEELDRRQAVVFVHPSNPTCCNPVNVGVPSAFAEWPFDTARTVMSLWASNALLRWPHIRFIFSHGGGALPMIADRIDKFGRPKPGAGPDGPRLHDALSQIRTLYFDTANAANPPALAATRAMADPGHILFGSDYPYIPAARAVDGLARAQLNRQELRAIERDNAIALMPRLGALGRPA